MSDDLESEASSYVPSSFHPLRIVFFSLKKQAEIRDRQYKGPS